MSREQWNSRYLSEQYVYGTEPNQYLKDFLENHKTGRILFPAEGEGRNAVFAASLGWQVDAFDQSETGKEKALRLAHSRGVKIEYAIHSLEDWICPSYKYDCIALIYVHMMPVIRTAVHKKMASALAPGGILLLEAFTRNQMPRTTGGPKNLELLYDAQDIRSDFSSFEIIEFDETLTYLNEGDLHQGLSDVVRLIARNQ